MPFCCTVILRTSGAVVSGSLESASQLDHPQTRRPQPLYHVALHSEYETHAHTVRQLKRQGQQWWDAAVVYHEWDRHQAAPIVRMIFVIQPTTKVLLSRDTTSEEKSCAEIDARHFVDLLLEAVAVKTANVLVDIYIHLHPQDGRFRPLHRLEFKYFSFAIALLSIRALTVHPSRSRHPSTPPKSSGMYPLTANTSTGVHCSDIQMFSTHSPFVL